jgi:hypothetical protein
MPRAWSNKERGFSAVEALLAAAVFGVIVTAIIGALVYGRASTAYAGERQRANLIAEEGVEAARNIGDASFANLADGTFGLAQSGGVWTFSGSSDTTNTFTRQITISTPSTNRKLVTSTVSWTQGNGTNQTTASTLLTNWSAVINTVKSWANAFQQSVLDLPGSTPGFKIATQGDYAYVVRNATTANFYIINIANPSAPTIVSTLNLAASPTNIDVVGNYAYVTTSSDTAELQIVNVTNPAAPTLTSSYNATGAGDGRAVDVVGTLAYLVRSANGGSDEFVIVNVATPASPTRVGGYSSNITMYDVKINGTGAYIATSSDTQEFLVIGILVPALPTFSSAINLPGTTDATSLDHSGTQLVIAQGTILYTYNTFLGFVAQGTITLSGTIQDISLDTVHNYVHVGTNAAGAEFQVININTPTAPAVLKTVDIAGSSSITGVAYSTTKDVTPAVSPINVQEVIIFGPN